MFLATEKRSERINVLVKGKVPPELSRPFHLIIALPQMFMGIISFFAAPSPLPIPPPLRSAGHLPSSATVFSSHTTPATSSSSSSSQPNSIFLSHHSSSSLPNAVLVYWRELVLRIGPVVHGTAVISEPAVMGTRIGLYS